jgi:hypothetical protein
MSKQRKKYNLAMCGEYYVAGELHRRGIPASITYGNAKKADVIATSESGESVTVIEVKTTSQTKWVVGQYVPKPSEKIWVFVHVPNDSSFPPSFYILTQSEIADILAPLDAQYRQRYKEKHGVEYGDKPGVCSLKRTQIEGYQGRWEKIADRIGN